MAVNPLATDDLTIDFRELMEIPVSQRVQAAETSSSFVDAILQAMTPFQVAQAFPSYYKKLLPDISNFITTNIERKLSAAGRGYDQTGGGAGGSAQPYYSGEGQLPGTARPQGAAEPTIDDMKKSLLKRGIDVDKTYQAIGTGLAVDDPQVEFLKGMSPEKLSSLGIETYQNDSGQSLYRVKPVAATTMSDEDVLKAMAESSGKVVPGAIRTSGANAAYYDKMYNAVYKAAVEKGVPNPEVIARLGATQTSLETGYGEHMVGNNAFGVKANKGGPSVQATTKEYINGRWVTIKDNFRQYASPEESAADYVAFLQENKRYKDVLAAKTIEEAIIAQGQTGYASDPGYESKLKSIHGVMSKGASSASVNKDMTEIIANSTPEEIKKFREDLVSTQKKAQFDNYVKGLYGQTLTSSSASVIDKEYQFTDKLGQITSNPRQYQDIYGKSEAGEFNYSLSPEGIQRLGLADETGRLTPASVEKNLVEIETNNGVKVKVHKSVAENTRAFLNQLEARGYPLRQADTGGYAWRTKAKSSGLSTHSTGTSLDLNWNSNWGEFGAAGNIDLPPEVEKLANYYGFSWGAKFGDPMHFEAMSPELHQQRLEQLQSEGYIKKIEEETPVASPAPAESPQQTSTVPAPEEPTPQAMALGGFIPEKDNLSVMNAQGDVVAKINEGELQQGLTREGSGMRVESNKKRMAESLVDQNERSMYESDINEPEQETEQTNAGGFRQVQKPARITNDVMLKDQQWREAAASASYPIGSQIRAFKRSKFMQEGYHFNRATPGSQT